MPEPFNAIPAASPILDEEGQIDLTDLHYLRDVRNDLRSTLRDIIAQLKTDINDVDSDETRVDCATLLDWLRTTWETMPCQKP